MISRRAMAAGCGLALASPARAVRLDGPAPPASLAALEAAQGGRLGVAIRDTGRDALLALNADRRFPLCSTFKLLAAAFVLRRVDLGQESLDRRVVYSRDSLVPYSPITAPRAGAGGMTVGELCAAAITLSDNAAGNLLLDSIGGPLALTGFVRTLGDPLTRLDRREPALNEAAPDDPRDTTTPAAMLGLLQSLALGDALSPTSRARLVAWLLACRTGANRLRAGIPPAWRVADKTGTGGRRATNDVAVAWPPGRKPILIVAYSIDGAEDEGAREAVLAGVGRLAASF